MDTKMSHAQVKREVIEDLIKVFEASGVEYTCKAVFVSVVRPKASYYAHTLWAAGYTFSRSSYFPVTAARDNFASWAANEYHERYFNFK